MPRRKRILIVEDEPVTAEDIKRILEELNYNVINIITSGERAVEEAFETKPDIILMDIFLDGGSDGITSAEMIKEKLNVPIVYITAVDDDKTFQRAIVTEPYGYIIKPFRKKDLESTIELAIYKHNKEMELIKSLENKQKSSLDKKSYSKRQKEIIQIAMEIISERGIQNLTIKNIAKEINVSLPAIYKHFKSKTEIMQTMIKDFVNHFEKIIDSIKNMEISPEDSIKNWFFMFVKTFIENPEFITIFTSKEILRSEENLLNDIHQIYKNHKKNLVDLIVNAQRINIIKSDINPMHLAIIIIGGVRNMIEDWKLSDYSFDIQKESERLWESIRRVMMN